MPHSSGGGSFSGGIHSGTSSGPYRSGSGSRLGSSEPAMRFSHRPMPGAVHYVIYGFHGRRRDYYCTGKPSKPNMAGIIFLGIIMTVVALPTLWSLWHAAFFHPQRANTEVYTPTLVVEDYLDLMESRESLDAAMESFLETTGVATGVEIVPESEWQNCDDLGTFAYNEYLRLYNDEMHWLFVISYPDDPADRSTGWGWEAVIGDDVSGVISEKSQDRMSTLLQQALLRSAPEQIGDGVAEALTELESTVMDFSFSASNLLTYIIGLGLYAFLMYLFVVQELEKIRVFEKGVKVDTGAQLLNCPSCGCSYYRGTVNYCPQCGNQLLQ